MYFLIFKNNENNTVIVEKESLNEIYEIITQYKMPENTYRIIKGEKIV